MWRNSGHNPCQLLPNDVRNMIGSMGPITTVAQCVEELVMNSIDAGASYISIYMDLSVFRLEVEDDGQGISKDDVDIIGTRYCTSKYRTIQDLLDPKHYGHHGEALANIIDISSTVEIYSRRPSDQELTSKKFKEGTCRGSIRPIDSRKYHLRGVAVSIHGLFTRVPDLQKLISPSLEIENIKKVLQWIYLMNPRVRLDFKNQGNLIFQTPAAGTNSVTQAFQFLFKKTLIEDFSSSGVLYYFQIWFTKEIHSTKALQFVFINNRHTSRNDIHRSLNRSLSEILGLGNATGRLHESTNWRGQYPIFVLNILTARTEYKLSFEPMRTRIEFTSWSTVLTAVEALGLRFKSALDKENRNKMVMDWMTKAEGIPVSNSSAAAVRPEYWKSISTRAMSSATHSNFATRTVRPSPLPPIAEKPQRNPHVDTGRFEGYDRGLYDDEGGIPNVDATRVRSASTARAVKSKMAQLTESMRPKCFGSSMEPTRNSQDVLQKHVSTGKAKRNSEEPQFPNDFNSKRSRPLSFSPPNSFPFPSSADRLRKVSFSSQLQAFSPLANSKSIEWINTFEESPLSPPIPQPRLLPKVRGTVHNEVIRGTIPPENLGFRPTPTVQASDDLLHKAFDTEYLKESQKTVYIPPYASEAAHSVCPGSKNKFGVSERGHTWNYMRSPDVPKPKPAMIRHGRVPLLPNPKSDTGNMLENRRHSNMDFSLPRPMSFDFFENGSHEAQLCPINSQTGTQDFGNQHRSNTNFAHPHPVSLDFFGNCNGSHEAQLYAINPRTGTQNSEYSERRRRGPIGVQPLSLDKMRPTTTEYSFVKDDIQRMRVIAQVYKKFIVVESIVNGKESFIFFDQHAVHERILLQNVSDGIRENGNNAKAVAAQIKRVVISPPLQLELSDKELRVVASYPENFELVGIQVKVHRNLNLAVIHSAPVWCLEHLANENVIEFDVQLDCENKIRNLIHDLLQQQVRHILDTSGNVELIPQAAFDLLCTQSCLRAIKLGESLDLPTCKELMAQLSLCENPFECTHGRPSLTPLLDETGYLGRDTYRADISCSIGEK